jgi:hypothetical protein
VYFSSCPSLIHPFPKELAKDLLAGPPNLSSLLFSVFLYQCCGLSQAVAIRQDNIADARSTRHSKQQVQF